MSSSEFTNELIHESSPYLLQHARNPVMWYPWGEQALQLARNLDKPILVSIGYSACHWCHVMERESFEDKETAAFMNEFFINVKIDREERPDLDSIYMDAVQTLTGSGGWPLNVFLTPEGLPFYGGTYFPPVSMYNRPSWKDVIFFINDVWASRRKDAEEQAAKLTAQINSFSSSLANKPTANFSLQEKSFFDDSFFLKMKNKLMESADLVYGGFGRAPKFPQSFTIRFLLLYGFYYKDEQASRHALFSLKAMLNGGIFDQLGGGFARYSTDDIWLAPHFEKMLYDNALLVIAMCDAFKISGDSEIKKGIEKTLAFILEVMDNNGAGYIAALDADSEGVEGKFYVWQKQEIEEMLGEEATLFCRRFGVEKEGNWEHTNILHVHKSIEDLAAEEKLSIPDCEEKIARAVRKLQWERSKRVEPAKDDKILLGWNSLLLEAFCRAAAALGNQTYKEKAETLYNFIDAAFTDDGIRYFHTYKNGIKKQEAFLDDYASLISSCIALQEVTGNDMYIEKAKQLTGYVIEAFLSAPEGLFYYTGKDQDNVLLRKIEMYDNATPSGNSMMAENLLYLSRFFEIAAWERHALSITLKIRELASEYPSSFAVWCSWMLKYHRGIKEVVVTGDGSGELKDKILKRYVPGMVLQSADVEKNYPLLKNKAFGKHALIYVCENFSCAEPMNDMFQFEKLTGNN